MRLLGGLKGERATEAQVDGLFEALNKCKKKPGAKLKVERDALANLLVDYQLMRSEFKG